MTPVELAELCAQAMSRPGHSGVVLTLPRGGTPTGFPRGELLNEMRRNGVVERTIDFEPERIIAWMVRHGLLLVSRDEDGRMRFEEPPEPGP